MFRKFRVGQLIEATHTVYSSTERNSVIIRKGDVVRVNDNYKELSFFSNGREWFLYRSKRGIDRTRFFKPATVKMTVAQIERELGHTVEIIAD